MPVFKVSVKWGKEKFDLEADNDDAPSLFKAQLFALSNVPPERQKIMVKGTTLKDESWGNVKLKNGLTLLMMGSADALPEAPADKPVFMEDMTESQLASHVSKTGSAEKQIKEILAPLGSLESRLSLYLDCSEQEGALPSTESLCTEKKIIEESLTVILIKLDSVDVGEIDKLRKLRKDSVNKVQSLLNSLEGEKSLRARIENEEHRSGS